MKTEFTIACNKCGTIRELTYVSKCFNGDEGIEFDVFYTGYENEIRSIDIDCRNPKCNNGIELDF